MPSEHRHPHAEAIEVILRSDPARPIEVQEDQEELLIDEWLTEPELQALEDYNASRVQGDS